MRLIGRLATFLAGLVGGGLGLLLVLPLGLVVIEWVVFPTALAVGALLAALAAGWVGTWTAGDGTRTRLGAVVAVVEAAGLTLALVVLGSAALRGTLLGPVIGIAGVASLLLAAAASVATWRCRRPADGPRRDLALTLALLAVAAVGVPTVVALAGLAGLAGA
jgi:hypothetical protein